MVSRGIKVFDKETLALAAGGATSGFITGFIRPMLGGFVEPVPGILEIAVGYAGARFLGKKGLMRAYFKGVMVAGLANAIASFIPAAIGGTFPSGKGLRSQQVDGPQHTGWVGESDIYIHRNPVIPGTASQTQNAPIGTHNLGRSVQSAPVM